MSPSAGFPFESHFVDVHGARMHYVEEGSGSPIVFVHGNPTSSYLWRNILPAAADHGRAIALDLIGMGRSGKPDLAYRFGDHTRFFDGFMDALGLDDVVLVLHDWGGGIGMSWARRHPERVRGIVFMESVYRPMDWSEADLPTRLMFKRMRHPEKGRRMNQEKAFFLKRLMPMMTRARLSGEVRAAYMAPYPTPESRRPVAQWPMEIPIGGEPADVTAEIAANHEWFTAAPIPKLFLHAKPGVIMRTLVPEIERDVANLTSTFVGKGKHYIQEDQPSAIAAAISEWLATLPPVGVVDPEAPPAVAPDPSTSA